MLELRGGSLLNLSMFWTCTRYLEFFFVSVLQTPSLPSTFD